MSFGIAPFGLSPWAAYYTAVTPNRRGVSAATARNVENGDYTQDDDGNLNEAASYIDQEVMWRINTELGSFPGDLLAGNGVTRIRIFNDTSQVRIENAVSIALEPMLARGVIKDLRVIASPYTQNGNAVGAYSVFYKPTGVIER
jgi:hypothetical protein